MYVEYMIRVRSHSHQEDTYPDNMLECLLLGDVLALFANDNDELDFVIALPEDPSW
jgi:hypothetical protein